MDGIVEKVLSFVDSMNEIDDAVQLMERFSAVVQSIGFRHFIMTGLPAYGEDVEKLIVANGWPQGWMDRYREGRYFFDDPVSQAAFVSAGPYTWREARSGKQGSPRAAQIEDEAKAFGLVDGLAIPLFDPNNWQAVVSLAADQPIDISPRLVALLQGVAPLVHGQLSDLLEGRMRHVPRLSPREAEVLTWLAHGKTGREVASILCISEDAVRKHLKNASAKLNTSSATHSVAMAIHSRQIRL